MWKAYLLPSDPSLSLLPQTKTVASGSDVTDVVEPVLYRWTKSPTHQRKDGR